MSRENQYLTLEGQAELRKIICELSALDREQLDMLAAINSGDGIESSLLTKFKSHGASAISAISAAIAAVVFMQIHSIDADHSAAEVNSSDSYRREFAAIGAFVGMLTYTATRIKNHMSRKGTAKTKALAEKTYEEHLDGGLGEEVSQENISKFCKLYSVLKSLDELSERSPDGTVTIYPKSLRGQAIELSVKSYIIYKALSLDASIANSVIIATAVTNPVEHAFTAADRGGEDIDVYCAEVLANAKKYEEEFRREFITDTPTRVKVTSSLKTGVMDVVSERVSCRSSGRRWDPSYIDESEMDLEAKGAADATRRAELEGVESRAKAAYDSREVEKRMADNKGCLDQFVTAIQLSCGCKPRTSRRTATGESWTDNFSREVGASGLEMRSRADRVAAASALRRATTDSTPGR